jgi:hypothetical protein
VNHFDALINQKTPEQRREWLEPSKRVGAPRFVYKTATPPPLFSQTTTPVNAAALVFDHRSGTARLVPVLYVEIA